MTEASTRGKLVVLLFCAIMTAALGIPSTQCGKSLLHRIGEVGSGLTNNRIAAELSRSSR
jgi:hypothetical protein